jgi:hypothetical protein
MLIIRSLANKTIATLSVDPDIIYPTRGRDGHWAQCWRWIIELAVRS